jgi:hypothetical protein
MFMYSQHHLTTKFIFKRCQSHNQYIFIKFSIPEEDKNFSFKIHIKIFCNFDINLSDTGILEIICCCILGIILKQNYLQDAKAIININSLNFQLPNRTKTFLYKFFKNSPPIDFFPRVNSKF